MSSLLVSAGLFLFGSSLAHAAPQEMDLRSKTVFLHSTWTVGVNLSTNAVLLDLNDSTGTWPNPTGQTGYFNLTHISLTLDKLAASSATAKIGVVNYIDTSTGSVKYFFEIPSGRNVSNTLNNATYHSDNTFICTKVIPATPNSGLDGTTPFLLSNEYTSGSTTFQSDVILPNPTIGAPGIPGVSIPGLGDIILTVVNPDATNSVGVIIDIAGHYEVR